MASLSKRALGRASPVRTERKPVPLSMNQPCRLADSAPYPQFSLFASLSRPRTLRPGPNLPLQARCEHCHAARGHPAGNLQRPAPTRRPAEDRMSEAHRTARTYMGFTGRLDPEHSSTERRLPAICWRDTPFFDRGLLRPVASAPRTFAWVLEPPSPKPPVSLSQIGATRYRESSRFH